MLEELRRSTVAAMLCGALCTATAAAQSARAPDLILAHGTVLTVDPRDSVVQALAVRDGKVLKAGSDAAILALAGPRTRIVDLHGRTATPGLIDNHAHVAAEGVEYNQIALDDASSVAEILERVRAKAAQAKPGEWIQGHGWDEAKLREHRYVTAADLDAVAPNNPVWLRQVTAHYGVANSYALRLAKVTDSTPNPPAGTIDRDSAGHITGVLKENAAMGLVTSLIPPPTPEQWREGLLRMFDRLHQEGMTAYKDPYDTQPMWDAYRSLLDAGQLTEHVCVLWFAGTTLEEAQQILKKVQSLPRPPESLGEGRLVSCGVKLVMDGSGGGRTAWMYQEWHKNGNEIDHGNYGYPYEDPAVYRQMVRLFHQAGIHVGTHTIGDRAIDWVVDTYAQVEREKPTRGLRHAIIHANLPSEHAIEVMAMLEKKYDAGYPEMQPPFMWWLGDNYAGNLGPERALHLEPLKTLLARGVRWSGGSDFEATPLPARYGIWAAMERETLKGQYGAHPFGTAEDVDVHTALRAYTTAAARQLFLEDRIGSLEPGKDADIAVWDRNPYSVPGAQLKDMKCEMTLFHGQIVYEAQ